MIDQSIAAHTFLDNNILANANELINWLLEKSQNALKTQILMAKYWQPEECSWYEDLFMQYHEEDLDDYDSFSDNDTYPREPYEFYFVSEYFAKKLIEQEALVSNSWGLWIWGRETTGQSIILDHVFQQIWKDHKGWLKDDDN